MTVQWTMDNGQCTMYIAHPTEVGSSYPVGILLLITFVGGYRTIVEYHIVRTS